jgi:hypothetical protein
MQHLSKLNLITQNLIFLRVVHGMSAIQTLFGKHDSR